MCLYSILSCSSDDDSNTNNSSQEAEPKISFKVNGIEVSESISYVNGSAIHSARWYLNENLDGTFNNHISSITNNGFIDLNLKESELVEGQIYNLDNLGYTFITYNDKNYYIDNTTMGQILITQISNNQISGTFYFENLYSGYQSLPYINVTDGVFTNIDLDED